MLPCSNKQRGCPKYFSNDIGRRIHLRSCAWTACIPKAKRARKAIIPVTLGGNDLRLPCDVMEFGDIPDVKDNEEEFVVIEERLSCYNDSKCWNAKCKIHFDAELQLSIVLHELAMKAGQKQIDSVLHIIRDPSFDISLFVSTFSSAKDCREMITSRVDSMAGTFGFKKTTFQDEETKVAYTVYMRSPVEVLKARIRESSPSYTFYNPPNEEVCKAQGFCHPMMAALGQEGTDAVKEEIMEQRDDDVFSRVPSECGESSFVGIVQICSDKSKTSLKESAFEFHPIVCKMDW